MGIFDFTKFVAGSIVLQPTGIGGTTGTIGVNPIFTVIVGQGAIIVAHAVVAFVVWSGEGVTDPKEGAVIGAGKVTVVGR